MKTAKFQAYRNLHKPGFFSVKHRGLVIDYMENMVMEDCVFFVSEKGRIKTVTNRRKGVHAWVAGVKYSPVKETDILFVLGDKCEEVWYSPYYTKTFIGIKSGKVYDKADKVYFHRNKCYCLF